MILDSAHVHGNVRLDESHTEGRLSAWRVRVDGAFNCRTATFDEPRGGAFNLRNADIGRDGEFSGLTASGLMDLRDARFGGRVSMDGTSVVGEIRLQNARIDGTLSLDAICIDAAPADQDEADNKTEIGATNGIDFSLLPPRRDARIGQSMRPRTSRT